MITIRHSKDRGHANHGWLDTYHSFSFSSYYDPRFTGFRDLLVINEDYISAGQGFGTHGHSDMEIITYVLDGELAHKDSMGTTSTLKAGEVQRMSAGTGIRHSEFNASKEKPVHLLQIWITPEQKGIKPSYEEKTYTVKDRRNHLKLIVSPNGKEDSMRMNQNAELYATILDDGKTLEHKLKPGRHAWVQVARGSIELNGQNLSAGDGAAVSEENLLKFKAQGEAEFLVFDLP